ncbi:MAG: hypothetical protein AB7I08_15225 [Thermoleophilia bacterium]
MKLADVMTAHPILVTARTGDANRVRTLMQDAQVNHVPVVEGPLLLGVWAHREDDSVILLGPERVVEMSSDADAGEAMAALMREAEVVLVRDEDVPRGVLTRSDALAILRAALARGTGARHHRPTVIRLAGTTGAGKTTLVIRTLSQLPELDAVVLQANQPTAPETLQGLSEVQDASVHWRAGLTRAVARVADAQLIFVEDRDGEPDLSRGIGEDLQVAVLRAGEVASLPTDRLDDAQAVVITRTDETGLHGTQEALAICAERWPHIEAFAVAADADDRGMDEWVHWIRRQVQRRRG